MEFKKAQAWGIDLTIAIIIFSIGILIFLIYSLNYSGDSKEALDSINYDGDVLFSNLLSEGYPQNWTLNDVVKIGILDNEKINETKLEMFYNLAKNDYSKTKTMFNTKFDYYFFMNENMTINSEQVAGIGKPGINRNNINATNLIKITRFIIYKEKPVTAYLYIWE